MNAPAPSSASGSWRATSIDDLEDERDAWPALALAADNIFATMEWLGSWWRHFGRQRPLHLVGLRDDDGRLFAVVPWYLAAARPLRVLRFLGHGPTDQLGPVCAVVDRPRVASMMGDVLGRLAAGGIGGRPVRWDLALADELPGDVHWADAGGARRLARRASLVTPLTGVSGEEWLRSRSRNLRDQLRKAERRLALQGAVRFRATTVAGDLDQDLDRFLGLHDDRWAGGSRSFAGRTAFHRDFAASALERGWLRLRFMEVDGRAVAGLYNLRFNGVESSYQASRSRAFDAFSVGLLLHAHAIRESADEGLREYRFLRGDEPYKRRFADVDAGLETVGWTRDGRGRPALALIEQMPRLPREGQRRVPAAFVWGTGGTPRWGPP